jgi:hypothetical protein
LEQEGQAGVDKKSYTWIKPVVWGVVGGIIFTVILGFAQFGWVLGSKAEQMASDRASTAVAVAPVCTGKFFAQADAPAKLVELKKLTSEYAQRDFVEKGGWATAHDSLASNYQLELECTKMILAAKPV